jgi:hypothetical protein
LFIFLCLLTAYFFRFKKKLDLFFQKGEKNLEELLSKLIAEKDRQESDLKKIFEEISRLNKISKISLQKVGVVRYNPFKDVGGDQSFSIALLDLENNGFVITSLYGREGNRVYAKPINKGNPDYLLSEEEKSAIKRAMEGISDTNPKGPNKKNRNDKK